MSSKAQRKREAEEAAAALSSSPSPTPPSAAPAPEAGAAAPLPTSPAPAIPAGDEAAASPLDDTALPREAEEAVSPPAPSLPPSSAAASPVDEAPPVTMNEPENETPASASTDLADVLLDEGVAIPESAAAGDFDDEAVEMPDLSDPDVLEGLPPGTTTAVVEPRQGREVRLTHVPKEEEAIEQVFDPGAMHEGDADLIVEKMLGRTLRCDDFEGAPAEGTVENENPSTVLLRLTTGRLWPVFRNRITGDTWQHVASDLPPAGEDKAFDAQYRTTTQKAPAFTPPAGFIRAWITAPGSTPAKGFTLRGVFKAMWQATEEGFFAAALVDHPKSHMKRVGVGMDGAPPRAVPPKPIGGPIHPPTPTPAQVAAVMAPAPRVAPSIPAGFIRAQVRHPSGQGSVSAAGRKVSGNPQTIWRHGEIGYFPAHAVRGARSNLVELPDPAPVPALTAAS